MKAIDKGIPAPRPKNQLGQWAEQYPVLTMAVGDSFAMTSAEFKRDQDIIRSYGYRFGKRFSIHRYADGYRVWRIK